MNRAREILDKGGEQEQPISVSILIQIQCGITVVPKIRKCFYEKAKKKKISTRKVTENIREKLLEESRIETINLSSNRSYRKKRYRGGNDVMLRERRKFP